MNPLPLRSPAAAGDCLDLTVVEARQTDAVELGMLLAWLDEQD
ncbi:hypothetical protein [Angustibacter luteus]|uniref:GNAT family N-acetyltransferase n=1 Tax=Angustibacter luteus TaxID=658456 RepID=A0ABW1JHN8_9ACTN